MKALLEFDLNDDNAAFTDAVNAPRLKSAMLQFAEELRAWDKHQLHDAVDADDAIRKVRQLFYECVQDNTTGLLE